jgi:hypothetical protein
MEMFSAFLKKEFCPVGACSRSGDLTRPFGGQWFLTAGFAALNTIREGTYLGRAAGKACIARGQTVPKS